jgi:hypothetical protein
MSAVMSRREFFSSLFTRGQAVADPCAGSLLPPEFTPEVLRAEAARMGLDTRQMTESEMAEAVFRAMYAQAPADSTSLGHKDGGDEAGRRPDASANASS